MDDDVKLSQTFAILKYLGRKHGLVGKSDSEHNRIDLIEAEAMDMRTRWVTLCYGPDFVSSASSAYLPGNFNKTLFCIFFFVSLFSQEKNRPEYLKNLALKLKELDDYLGSHQYFAGDHVIIPFHWFICIRIIFI